jgi:PAS domain S-box-containing protein
VQQGWFGLEADLGEHAEKYGMRLTPRTIVGQFIAGTLLVQLLVVCVFLSVSVRHQFREAQERDRTRLKLQTDLIEDLLEEPLTKNDPDLLDHVVHAIPIAASVRGARITDIQGSMLRNTSSDLPMVLTERERSMLPLLARDASYHSILLENGDLEGIQPVLGDGKIRGIVWVTQNTALALNTPTSVLDSLLIYAPFALVGNLLFVWALSGSMARPLRLLRHATQQVQRDPNDLSSFPLPANDNNEAGELTASFNAMVNEIGSQRRGIQETLNLLDTLLNSAPIGFGFYDREFRYVRLNEHLARMHGVPMEEHIGRRLRDLVPAGESQAVADQTERLIRQAFHSGKSSAEDEISGILPGHVGIRTWQVSYFPVTVAEGEIRWVGVIATEITERKRTEEAMRRSEKLAAEGRLATSIAQEITSPLESAGNLLRLLQGDNSLSEQGKHYVSMVQNDLSRMGETAQQTLRFYRQSSTPSDVLMSDLLCSVLVLHNERLKSPHIDVETRFEEKATLFGYSGELRQFFANLVSNAIDAMPMGGKLYVRVRTARRVGKRGLRITVADTGIGMPEAVRRRIFEPFFTTKEATGTGLGLWVSDEILKKHRGVMQVRSREARFRGDASGTVFSIFFPFDGVRRGLMIVHSTPPVLADNLV